jgi:hypothetical protein
MFFLLYACLHIVICHPQFVQCLLVFLILLCVFVGITCLIFYGTNNALLAFAVIIFSSHNIATSLCCYSVDGFILAIAILRYDYTPILNTIVRKLSMVHTCKP